MEMSDFSWQHQKYTRPEMYVVNCAYYLKFRKQNVYYVFRFKLKQLSKRILSKDIFKTTCTCKFLRISQIQKIIKYQKSLAL